MKYHIFTLITILGLAFIVASRIKHDSTKLSIGDNMWARVHTSFAAVPINEQLAKADIVVAGTVMDISATQWNQDNGEYWEEAVLEEGEEYSNVAVAYYTIELAVKQTIIADSNIGKQLEITVAAPSPLDDSTDVETPIQVGDEVVILTVHSQLAWRDGTQPILMFLSSPESSLYKQGEDGLYHINNEEKGITLEELITEIAEKRPDVIQP